MLEIGCGDGRMILLCAEQAREVLGVDVEEESIREARAAACCSRASAAVAPELRSPFE